MTPQFFGSEVWGFARSRRGHLPDVDHFCTSAPVTSDVTPSDKSLADLLSNCDYICSVLPKTPDTDNLLSNGVLKHCKGDNSLHCVGGRF
jgi:lactate dehydrogenase-like 2-hydroxyacid dehydrogenase